MIVMSSTKTVLFFMSDPYIFLGNPLETPTIFWYFFELFLMIKLSIILSERLFYVIKLDIIIRHVTKVWAFLY